MPVAVVYSETGEVDEAGLIAFLDGRLAKFKIPAKVWVHREPLPKLGTGKIDKVQLRDRYRAELASNG